MLHYLSKGDDGTAIVKVDRRLKNMPGAMAGILCTYVGGQLLISFQTIVAEIDVTGWLYIYFTYSKTTMRHIRAFLDENGVNISCQTIKDLCTNRMIYNVYTGEVKHL